MSPRITRTDANPGGGTKNGEQPRSDQRSQMT